MRNREAAIDTACAINVLPSGDELHGLKAIGLAW
jgi:hypothetical protein